MIRSAPDRTAAYGRPHALAWNIGTTGSTRSLSQTPRVLPMQTPIECR